MDFSINVEGLDSLATASEALRQAVAEEIQKGLYVGAQKVRTEAIKSLLEGGKTGRIYKRRSVTHQASAPGEAPASDTGRLVGSIAAYNTGGGEAMVIAGLGSVKYANMLEFGTARIAPRPFMFPAYEKSKQWIYDRLQDAMNLAITRLSKR